MDETSEAREIAIPDYCLALVVGRPEATAAAFAATAFPDTEIIAFAPDAAAFVEARLRDRRFTVVDASGCTAGDYRTLLDLAKDRFTATVGFVIADAQPGPHRRAARHARRELSAAGIADVHYLTLSLGDAARRVTRIPLACDRRTLTGAFDIVGDVHGCRDELIELMHSLGYEITLRGKGAKRQAVVTAPAGRKAVFVGDLVDRGPASPDVLRIVMAMVANGQALTVLGNHDSKFMRWLQGRQVKLTHGLETTVTQFRREPASLHTAVRQFFESCGYQLWLDNGALVVAHAGVRADMIGREAGAVRAFCLFGDRSGGKDEFGLPVRYHWALDYDGPVAIIYGHTPISESAWVNNTLCIDTACAFGGHLTALRWPEREIVSVPARQAYAKRARPLGHPPPRPKGSE